MPEPIRPAPAQAAAPLTGISSMATRLVLAELAERWQQLRTLGFAVESVGGVDAARRVAAGEAFDVVLLASDAIDRLIAAGHALAGSRVDLMRSDVAAAVPAGAPRPDLSSEAAMRAAVAAAPTLGVSTGPSGVALLERFAGWGLGESVRARLVQARPGVPVGSLVARGEVALGFQQASELIHVDGIELIELPAALQVTTIFSGAVCRASTRPQLARELLDFLASPPAAAAKQRQGMQPA